MGRFILSVFSALLLSKTPAEASQGIPLFAVVRTTAQLPTPPVQVGDARFTARNLMPHQVALLSNGPADLALRLFMIRNAQKEVDIESYVFDLDVSGRLLLQELINRKRQLGPAFRVRILVDDWLQGESNKYRIDPATVALLLRENIEFKYYNTSVLPWNRNHRSHKKIFLVDGKHFITGGRNIQDSYFGINLQRNFLDTDIYVQGPAAGSAQGAFNVYWDSKVSSAAQVNGVTAAASLNISWTAQQPQFLPLTRETLAKIETKGQAVLAQTPIFKVSELMFLSDLPGEGNDRRLVANTFRYFAEQTKQNLLIENWAFVPIEEEKKMFERLLIRHVPVTLLTNSLISSRVDLSDEGGVGVDMMPVSHPRQAEFARKKMRVFAYSGKSFHDDGLNSDISQGALWAIHTKRACMDHETCFIGSSNLDPRSGNINSEIAVVVVQQPEFAKAVEASILERVSDAYRVTDTGTYLSYDQLGNEDGAKFEIAPPQLDRERYTGLNRLWNELTIELR